MMDIKERIRCAAIKLPDGTVILGAYHGECLKKAGESGVPRLVVQQRDDGFATESGRFVDRVEGLRIATDEGQIIKKYNPTDVLLSEDIGCPKP